HERAVGQAHDSHLGEGGADIRTDRQPVLQHVCYRVPSGGTTAVPVAVTATTTGSSTSAADSDSSGRPRHTTRHSKSMVRLRVPTRVIVPLASTTSPARSGARNCTSE